MKKFLLAVAGAAAVTATVVPAAQAGPATAGLKVTTTSTKAGTKAKPRAQGVKFTLTASPAGEYAAKRAIVSLDKNYKFNTTKFGKCAEAVVQEDPGSCPAASKVGSGKATAVVAKLNNLTSTLKVTAFNGGKDKLFLRVETKEPIEIAAVLVGKLKPATGKFGRKLDVTIPESLQNIGGAIPTLTEFITKIQKTNKGVPYIATTGCSGGKWNFRAQVFYTDNTDTTADTKVNCKK